MDTAPESPANVATLERPPSLLSASTSEAAGESSVAVEPRPQELRLGDDAFDVAVVGSGPGGYVAAIRAAQLELRAAIIEKNYLGGTCLNVGCIPTKAMLSSVEALSIARRGKDFGFTAGEVTPDYPAIVKRRDRVVEQLRSGVQALMKANRITVFHGHGQLRGGGRVQVRSDGEEQEVEARNVLIATGDVPAPPPIPGMGLEGVVNSDQLLQLESIPSRLAVVGAGAVGLEWADIFGT